MIPISFVEIEQLALGRLANPPADGIVRRIHDDSRRARAGDLFVALNSGSRYLDEAVSRGAATLIPDHQEEALAALASLVRARSHARVVAVVGSTGKTTTKDALGALCAAVTPTVQAERSRNNELGLPLTVLAVEPDTEVLVTEMGMRGAGQIAALCAIARPSLVLVSAIGPEHLELVGSVEAAARANAEAVEALPVGGVAVVPTDAAEQYPFLVRDGVTTIRFDPATVERLEGSRWGFAVPGRAGEEPVAVALELPFDQRHLAANVLGALAAYRALGLPLERAQEGASRIQLSPWRGEVSPLAGGGLVVNDAYNANPLSMRAAILDLAERAGSRRKVAILGEMAELGVESLHHHREIAEMLRAAGVDLVLAVGEVARPYLDGAPTTLWAPDAAGVEPLLEALRPGDAVLVKGSRSVGLEGISRSIENLSETWSAS